MTLFELKQIEVQYSKNDFKILLPQEIGTFRNKMEREPQKTPQIEKICILYIYR